MTILIKTVVLAAGLAVAMSTPVSRESLLETLMDKFNNNQFSSQLFQNVMGETNQNRLTSPINTLLLVAMTYFGSAGSTAAQIRKALKMPSNDLQTLAVVDHILRNLQNPGAGVEFLASRKMFVDEQLKIEDAYEKIIETHFRSNSQKVPFADTKRAAKMINDYFKEQTKGLVKDVVSTEDLGSSTVMTLVDALYFKGNWSEPFDPKLTVSKPFHISKYETKNVPTMHKQTQAYHGQIRGLGEFVQLDYQGSNVKMIIILPDSDHYSEGLASQVITKNMDAILSNESKKLISLSLPKFKLDVKTNLNELLQYMGMTEMFESGADFSKMSKTPLHIGNVVQRMAIEVNEFGTETASAGGVGVAKSFDQTEEFKVDKPFLFSIISKLGVVFMGKVVDPTA